MRHVHLLFFLFLLPFAHAGYALTVITQGSGFVSSSPSGILCGAACLETYDAGTSITLVATAQGGAFQSWSGACSGTQATCTVTLDGPKVITATFAGQTLSEYALTVYKSGDGSGTVSSDPYGISLGQIAPYDSAKYQASSSVTLTASVQAGSRFDGWSGACNGTQTTCTVKMDAAQSATATFSKSGSPVPTATPKPTATTKPSATPSTIPTPSTTPTVTATPTPKPTAAPTPVPQFELTITKSGSGRGALYVWPSGRSQELCGSSEKECTYTYPYNTPLTFQTIPLPDAQFERWSGACNGLSCSFNLDGDKALTAAFGPAEVQRTSHEGPLPIAPIITPVPKPGYNPPFDGPKVTATPTPTPQAIFPLVIQISGKGGVRSSDYRINCGSDCESKFARYNQVPLTAIPAEGWKFAGWGGECRNAEGPGCVLSIEGSSFSIPTAYVRAIFEPGLQVLSVTQSGPGSISSSEYSISSPYNSAGQYKTDSTVQLTAIPNQDATFDRWEGECSHNRPGCSVTMTGPKSVKAFFKGPPAPKKLTLVYPKESGAKIKISTFAGVVQTQVKECSSNCTTEFKEGTKVELLLDFTPGYVFEGFGGSCIGDYANCYLDMYSDKTVTVSFSKANFKKLTVVQPQQGTVVSFYHDAKIRCGPKDIRCTADYDTRARLLLKFDGDYGLFESGCDAVWKRNDQYGRQYEECSLDMKQDRTVTTKMSPEQEKWMVGTAMREAFDMPDYPGLKEFATREDGVPFQNARNAFHLGNAGKNALELKAWILKNWDGFLKDSGIGQYMHDYDLRVVRRALYLTFNGDIESNKNKPWFKPEAVRAHLYDAGKLPVMRGLREWFGMHKKPIAEFEKHVMDNKLSYYVNEGIEPYFKEPPKATPTPTPKPGKPSTDPTLFRILPDNGQIGKPITLEGANLANIWKVEIDGNSIEFRKVDDQHIYLPTVRWGILPDFGFGSVITFQNYYGRYSSKLDAVKIGLTHLNAGGNKEQCFGAIGKGCGGLFGTGQNGESTNVGKRSGCEALRDNTWRACFISAGSIRHDNCCVWNPSGKWCGGPGKDGKPAEEWNHNGKCDSEWHESMWDSAWERTWKQDFSLKTDPNLSPFPSPNKRYFGFEADASTYLCAPKGTKMREDKDAPFCCSGRIDGWRDCT